VRKTLYSKSQQFTGNGAVDADQSFSFTENQSAGFSVGTVSASDNDMDWIFLQAAIMLLSPLREQISSELII